jgi:Protein of unknown function (DUF732)
MMQLMTKTENDEKKLRTMATAPLDNMRLKGALSGCVAVSMFLGLALSCGVGTAHAYTANEEQFLNQLTLEQVPGPNDPKLNDGYNACNHLRAGAQPWSELRVMSQYTGLSEEQAARVLTAATAWLCPDQNGKSNHSFWIGGPPPAWGPGVGPPG